MAVIYTSQQWSGARHQPGHLRVMAGEGRTHFLRGILFKAAFPCTAEQLQWQGGDKWEAVFASPSVMLMEVQVGFLLLLFGVFFLAPPSPKTNQGTLVGG